MYPPYNEQFFEEMNDCVHEWKVIESFVLRNKIITKKKICTNCNEVMTFGVPANSVKVTYSPPRINIPVMPKNTIPNYSS